jgi:hypothetical protein
MAMPWAPLAHPIEKRRMGFLLCGLACVRSCVKLMRYLQKICSQKNAASELALLALRALPSAASGKLSLAATIYLNPLAMGIFMMSM